MKERKKTTLHVHLLYISTDVEYSSLLALFHLCLVSVLLSGPSLTEIEFKGEFFSLVKQYFHGVCVLRNTNVRLQVSC